MSDEANARLIAAAPAMREALITLTRVVRARFVGLEIVALVPGELRAAIAMAETAIAMVEKGSSDA